MRRYNPNWASQPRVPRGNPDGGQWTDGGGGVGETTDSDVDPDRPESADDVPGVPVSDEGRSEPPEIPPERPSDPRVRNDAIRSVAKWLRNLALAGGPVVLFLDYINETWLRNDLNEIEAYLDEPKTLEELHDDVAFPKKGYQIHHIVEQTPAREDGDPEELIEGRENKVRIPTLIHREITNWYNTKNDDYGGMTPRDYLRGKTWKERHDLGLKKLKDYGVLLP